MPTKKSNKVLYFFFGLFKKQAFNNTGQVVHMVDGAWRRRHLFIMSFYLQYAVHCLNNCIPSKTLAECEFIFPQHLCFNDHPHYKLESFFMSIS